MPSAPRIRRVTRSMAHSASRRASDLDELGAERLAGRARPSPAGTCARRSRRAPHARVEHGAERRARRDGAPRRAGASSSAGAAARSAFVRRAAGVGGIERALAEEALAEEPGRLEHQPLGVLQRLGARPARPPRRARARAGAASCAASRSPPNPSPASRSNQAAEPVRLEREATVPQSTAGKWRRWARSAESAHSAPVARSEHCVTGSEKSPPGGETAPMIVTAPSPARRASRRAGALVERAPGARRGRSGSPPRAGISSSRPRSRAAPRPSARSSRS